MKKTNVFVAALLCIVLTGFVACKKNESSSGSAQMSVHLTDGPADYDAVYLDIQQIGLTMSGSSEVMLTPYRPGVYNILNFRNGLDTLLARNSIPAGTVNQIRLILGSNNSIVVDGVSHSLNTPSAQESGVKLNLNQTFAANGSYDIWIDFDAAKSIVVTGGGNYKLKPVMRAYSSLTNGKIEGRVLPAAAFTTVYAVNGTDTAAAIPAAADGYFLISGLPTGTYQVLFTPGISLYSSVSMNVNVSYGTISNVGTITLTP
ncbi:MAG: DUF4382 domain-containing protein [Bacteroidota bacterium]